MLFLIMSTLLFPCKDDNLTIWPMVATRYLTKLALCEILKDYLFFIYLSANLRTFY